MKVLTTEQVSAREERGKTIASLSGQIKVFEDSTYRVKSQSGKGVYEVLKQVSVGCVAVQITCIVT
jgi:hypothetical protein